MTFGSLDALRTLARHHLSSDVAERWVSLLRPAAGLDGAGLDAAGGATAGGVSTVVG
ncbi:hypothetical protein ACWGII_25125 [Streptomyces sp. NPDC054855]